MTRKEICRLFGMSEVFISRVFRNAKKGGSSEAKNIALKAETSTAAKSVNYTLAEVLYAMRQWNAAHTRECFTKMQELFLSENFIDHDGAPYIYRKKKSRFSRQAKSFIFLAKNSKGTRKVCCTCSFLAARKINKPGAKFSPYCNLYARFIDSRKIDIYKDRCTSYEISPAPPLVFTTDGVCSIDLEGNQIKKTLGIDNSSFTTGKTKKNNEPPLLANIRYCE